jgi:hypothetical protein
VESIIERNILVDKLISKMSTEYEAERTKLFRLLSIESNAESISTASDNDLDSVVEHIAYRTTLLSWIKTCIIDNNGMMFRAYQQSDGNDNAVFWVSTDCINILLEASNLIAHIGSKFSPNLAGIDSLLSITDTNVNTRLVSILEYAVYRKHKKDYLISN